LKQRKGRQSRKNNPNANAKLFDFMPMSHIPVNPVYDSWAI
jgi:hypothetical protein